MNCIIYNLLHNNFNKPHIKILNFFNKKHMIPFNCNITVEELPYYENSEYHYRDFYKTEDYNLLIKNKRVKKPISRRAYNMGPYYIPELPRGKIEKYEFLPVYIDKYNLIGGAFKIKYIITYTKNIESFRKKLVIYTGKLNDLKSLCELEFLPDNIEDKKFYKYVKWIPIYDPLIKIEQFFVIDFSNFTNQKLKNNSEFIICMEKMNSN
jgi:hypothetical protein